ncbi:MAG TPA: AraC family transcriptional regulator, partial [Polyangiaceae bacterium]|nr:AraC family transcriptional regulator [Polyangiaceae bacterium]
GALAGRMGDGACLLVTTRAKLGKVQRKRTLYEIAERMRSRAQRSLGLTLRAGISSHAAAGHELPAKYDEALVALQSAQQAGAQRAFYEELAQTGEPYSSHSLSRPLKDAFAQGTLTTLGVAIDSFQREVIARGHGSIEATKAYLDAAISDLVDLIERRSSVDARTLAELRRELADEIAQTMVLQDLAQWFALTVPRLFEMATEPARASQKERLERARGFIERNYREPLTLSRVAREAGFQPVYFSTLFKQRFKIGFERYLLERRLEAARYLLQKTRLSIASVALEAGFSSYPHLAKAFKRATNVTPKNYRRTAIKDALQPPER